MRAETLSAPAISALVSPRWASVTMRRSDGVSKDPGLGAHRPLEHRARQRHAAHPAVTRGESATGEDPGAVSQLVSRRAACPLQVGEEPGQELIERVEAAREQAVRMVALRHARARHGFVGELRFFDEDDLVEALGERRSREEPADAAADHDRPVLHPRHLPPGGGAVVSGTTQV